MRDVPHQRALDLAHIAEAWSRATDREILEFLDDPTDTPPKVVAIVQQEADRRNLAPGELSPTAPAGVRVLQRVIHHVDGFRRDHCLIAAALVGVTVALGFSLGFALIPWLGFGWRSWAVWMGFFVLYVAANGLVCWPLRCMRTALIGPLVAASGFFVVGFLRSVVLCRMPLPSFVRFARFELAMWWLIPCALCCLVVFLRTRYWPVRLPGHCVLCGYDLRGLSELRCPECGAPFEAAVPLTADEPRA